MCIGFKGEITVLDFIGFFFFCYLKLVNFWCYILNKKFKVTNQEEAIRKRDEELNVLRDRLANNEKEMLEIQLLLNRTEEEKISLQAQLQVKFFEF